eukprot:295620-Pyramimonas_sp.AAC.2
MTDHDHNNNTHYLLNIDYRLVVLPAGLPPAAAPPPTTTVEKDTKQAPPPGATKQASANDDTQMEDISLHIFTPEQVRETQLCCRNIRLYTAGG